MHVASAIEARHPCPDIHLEITQTPETWKNQFVPRRTISCGLAHWAVVDEGNAKVMMTTTPVNTELIGRVIDVACGRHHTLVLTENGVSIFYNRKKYISIQVVKNMIEYSDG